MRGKTGTYYLPTYYSCHMRRRIKKKENGKERRKKMKKVLGAIAKGFATSLSSPLKELDVLGPLEKYKI